MKLLFCTKCQDVFKLDYEERSCKCGEVTGHYEDNRYATTNGKGVSLAIGNGSLWYAIAVLNSLGDDMDREDYIHATNVISWVRPNEGTGNPHTKIQAKD